MQASLLLGGGKKPPSSLTLPAFSANGVNNAHAAKVASGTTTAATYPGTPQVSISGAGWLRLLGVSCGSTSGTTYLKVVIDGVTVFDHNLSTAGVGYGFFAVGFASVTAAGYFHTNFESIRFTSSVEIYTTHSSGGTDLTNIVYSAEVE